MPRFVTTMAGGGIGGATLDSHDSFFLEKLNGPSIAEKAPLDSQMLSFLQTKACGFIFGHWAGAMTGTNEKIRRLVGLNRTVLDTMVIIVSNIWASWKIKLL